METKQSVHIMAFEMVINEVMSPFILPKQNTKAYIMFLDELVLTWM